MFNGVVTDTNVVFYLMSVVGVIGVLAKAVNQITLRRMVKAAGNMSRSTHKLIKLVRSKYEHAGMTHDRVENVGAFVEKYIYEYRGFLLRIHTWRQLEIQTIWFSGILAALGAFSHYMNGGFSEQVYRYIGLGAAEMVLLFVVSQLSDESYKISAAKNYMVDYLENACAKRYKKTKSSEREQISIIPVEPTASKPVEKESAENITAIRTGIKTPPEEETELPIRIEGEPRHAEKTETAKQNLRRAAKEKAEEQEDKPALKEEAIRQILEEFLA